MNGSTSNDRATSRLKPAKAQSQTRISRFFHGVRQRILETELRTNQKSPLKQQAATVDATRAQQKVSVGLSKGIVVYSYICAPGYSVRFSVPGKNGIITRTSEENFSVKDLEVDTNNIPLLGGFTGRFQWTVLKMGIEKASGYNDINAVTGNVEDGTMVSIQQCIPVVTEDAIITCLFYDAGNGVAGLPKQDQCLITITPSSRRSWMEALVVPGSTEAQKPFSRFILPAPHDVGMNSMDNVNACLKSVTTEHIAEWIEDLPNLTAFKNFSPSALLTIIPDIVYDLAFTQTAPVATMLNMGARYFEFRPAKLYPLFHKTSGLRDTHYFTHTFLPGIAFDKFLDEIVQFLEDNQSEIIVVHIRWDGVVKDCIHATNDEVANYLKAACSQSKKTLTWTDRSGLTQSTDVLRKANKRIILLINASQYSSYSDSTYTTLVPTPIVNAFNGMVTQQQQTADITLLQCQATATNIKDVVAYSVLASNASNSPLAATKAICDQATLPWCRNNVLKNLRAEKPVIIMNDFFDGGTADTAVILSKQRFAAA